MKKCSQRRRRIHLTLLRRARGWSLADLAEQVGGPSRQMLHKYELGEVRPSPAVCQRLEAIFNIPISEILSVGTVGFSCSPVGYRHFAGIKKKEKTRIQESVRLALQPRMVLRSIFLPESARLPRPRPVRGREEIEQEAVRLRREWHLGSGPISHLVNCLEERGVQILTIDADRRFDGTGLVISGERGRKIGWAIVVRSGVCAERQRLSIAHELGHLFLEVPEGAAGTDREERFAFDFAGAFLAPAEDVYRTIGHKRRHIGIEELLLLKRRFGMSMQALLFRLRALNIITPRYFTLWFKEFGRRGWRAREPEEMPPEESLWLRQMVLRLVNEGIKTPAEVKHLFATSFERKLVESILAQRAS